MMLHPARTLLLASFTFICAACGDATQLDGELFGDPIEIESSAFVHFLQNDSEQIAVVLTNAGDACALIESGDIHLELAESGIEGRLKNREVLSLLLLGQGPRGLGAYPVTFGGDAFVIAQLSRTGGACEELVPDEASIATQGTVSLDSFEPKSGGKATGALDLTFPMNGGTISGEFEVEFCGSTNKSAPASCREE